MKKLIVFVLVLTCVSVFVGCAGRTEANTAGTETGYPDEGIQQSQIMYNGQIYFYFATGFNEPLPDGYEYVGSIIGIDNVNGPKEDFCGARVNLAQEVYADDTNPDTVYVKYKNGYAQFSIRK